MARRVSCIPSSDTAFHDAVAAVWEAIDGEASPHQIRQILCNALIGRYPRVDVHRQNELGRSFDEDVWYAYRDGRPLAPD